MRELLGWLVWLGRRVMVQSREAWPCLRAQPIQVWGLGQGETRQGKATHTGRGGGMDAILCV